MTLPPLPDRAPDALDKPETVANARRAVCVALEGGPCLCAGYPDPNPFMDTCRTSHECGLAVLDVIRRALAS